MADVVLFDVNETLLDPSPIGTWFDQRFEGAVTSSDWFAELLRLSYVSSVIDRYTPFTELAGHALTSVSERSHRATAPEDVQRIGELLRTLPPHADVAPGLQALGDAGVRTAALTNSPSATAVAQLTNAGLADSFEAILTVEMVDRFKPHRSVYEEAASRMGVATHACTMVAAHDWDIAGAMAAGCRGIFVARSGQTWSPAFGEPDHRVSTIAEAAAIVLASR